MSEYGIGREADTGEEPATAGGGEPWFERSEAAMARDLVEEPADDAAEDPTEEPVEEYADAYAESYADPQEWISSLIANLERAEQGIGSGPRDVLMARIKLAQAYSELGDTVQAAPLAVANVAQAQRLFPSSEGMLRQLREFRDAACEAAGWTAAMMREEAEEAAVEEEPSELVTRPLSGAQSEVATHFSAEPHEASVTSHQPSLAGLPIADSAEVFATSEHQAAPVSAPAPVLDADRAEDFAPAHQQPTPTPVAAEALNPNSPEDSAAHHEAPAHLGQFAEPESVGAVIHEFVRRPQEPDALQWAAEVQAALTQPAELAIPNPPEPEYAEEVEPALASADLADLSDLADLAAIEEIIRLRYELREAQRTIERLRHVNRKLREALEFEEAP